MFLNMNVHVLNNRVLRFFRIAHNTHIYKIGIITFYRAWNYAPKVISNAFVVCFLLFRSKGQSLLP